MTERAITCRIACPRSDTREEVLSRFLLPDPHFTAHPTPHPF
jgi:hypothetical protein